MWFSDGKPRTEFGDDHVLALFDWGPNVTMWDAYQFQVAGTPSVFDKIRHRGNINVAFVDGHVEVFSIPGRTIKLVGLNLGFQ